MYLGICLTKLISFPSTGDSVPDPMELGRPGGVLTRAVRATVPGLMGKRFMSSVRITDCSHWVVTQRQAHIQS